MLRSVAHCHQNNIVHRDVKLENFLVDTTEDGQILIKLADFGLACEFDEEQPLTTKCGSLLSVAPEMLVKKSYCHKVDVWGLGVILHELLSTKLPFYHDDENVYKNNIVKQRLVIPDTNDEDWDDVSAEAKDLIKKLLDKNPVTRLSAVDAMSHPWFNDITKPNHNNKIRPQKLPENFSPNSQHEDIADSSATLNSL